MSAPKLKPEQVEQIVEWREAGRSFEWIARRLGITDGAVHYQCLKHGAVSPRQKGRTAYNGPTAITGRDGITRRRFSADEDARMLALEAEGLSIVAIARKLGRANTSVRMRLMTLAQHEELAA